MIGCVLSPAHCVSTWLASIPLEWWIGAVLVAGMILGAILGRIGTPIVLAILGAVVFMAKRKSADEFHEHVGGKDAIPPLKPQMRPKGRTAADDWPT